ncbi:MAG: hydantoinase/oxoprolinase N-terminal domain-containing protein [Rhizomicrobium sp.]
MSKWNFYIDRGGTFTDIVAEAPDGTLSTMKLLSQSDAYDDAALEGIRRFARGGSVGEVRMGTTVATNALLERKGDQVVLVTTRGFADQLRIGYQNRPKLFACRIVLPDMLYGRVVEAEERVTADGEIRQPLDEGKLRRDLTLARADGFTSCAVLFLHSYRYPRARAARSGHRARGRLYAGLHQS